MEIEIGEEILEKEYDYRDSDKYDIYIKRKWIDVDDLLEWIKKHDLKIEDVTVYHHNGETYLKLHKRINRST